MHGKSRGTSLSRRSHFNCGRSYIWYSHSSCEHIVLAAHCVHSDVPHTTDEDETALPFTPPVSTNVQCTDTSPATTGTTTVPVGGDTRELCVPINRSAAGGVGSLDGLHQASPSPVTFTCTVAAVALVCWTSLMVMLGSEKSATHGDMCECTTPSPATQHDTAHANTNRRPG